MENEKFSALLEEIAEKIRSYPEDYTVDCLHIKMCKQRELWVTIPLLHNGERGERSVALNYKFET